MATPRRQNPLDSQDARTPMNGEPRTDLIQLITRTESLSSDDDLASPTDVDSSNWATTREQSPSTWPAAASGGPFGSADQPR
jgi:hypothetical protein